MSEEQAKVYKNPNNDPRGRWRPVPMTAQAGHATPEQFYEIVAPGGKVHTPPAGRCWSLSKKTFEELLKDGRIYFGKDNNSHPNKIRYLSEVPGVAPWTWWTCDEVGHTDSAKKEILALFPDNIFDTPKPETLIQRIIHIATNPNDLVLDSFLGSGTTAAVAHKMGRRYIGIEMGEHAYTHCKKRLDMVVSGEDKGGISKAAVVGIVFMNLLLHLSTRTNLESMSSIPNTVRICWRRLWLCTRATHISPTALFSGNSHTAVKMPISLLLPVI